MVTKSGVEDPDAEEEEEEKDDGGKDRMAKERAWKGDDGCMINGVEEEKKKFA